MSINDHQAAGYVRDRYAAKEATGDMVRRWKAERARADALEAEVEALRLEVRALQQHAQRLADGHRNHIGRAAA